MIGPNWPMGPGGPSVEKDLTRPEERDDETGGSIPTDKARDVSKLSRENEAALNSLEKQIGEFSKQVELAQANAEAIDAFAEQVDDLHEKLDRLINQDAGKTQQVGKASEESDREKPLEMEQEAFTR